MNNSKLKTQNSKLPSAVAHAVAYMREWLGLGFLLAVFSTVEVKLPMPLFLLANGSFVFYASEFAVGAGIIAAVILYIKKSYRPSPTVRAVLTALAAFLAWYVIVFASRVLLSYQPTPSVLTLRTTVLPIFILLMMDMGWENGRRCILGLTVYNFAICAVQIYYATAGLVRMSPFMGNLMVFTCAAVMLVPTNFYVIYQNTRGRCGPLYSAMAMFNIFCVIFFSFMGGARSTVAASILGIAASFAIFWRKPVVKKRAYGAVILSFAVILALWIGNFGGKAIDGIYRVVPTPSAVASKLGMEELAKILPGGDDYEMPGSKGNGKVSAKNRIKIVQIEKEKSDIARSDLWASSLASIARSPVIGEGIIYFEFRNDYNVDRQAAHNFILEHINAYGTVGFIFWAVLLIIPTWVLGFSPKYGRIKKRKIPKLCLICSVGMMAVQSLAQPTMMVVPTVTLLWLVIGSWYDTIVSTRNSKCANQ